MIPIRYIHAADLHLDCQFKGLRETQLSSSLSKRIKEATFTAYENLIDLCIRKNVDFLLIAGDVYNSADRNLNTQIRFRNGISRLGQHGIKVFVVHGNHDPLDSWSSNIRFPENVHIFGNYPESVEYHKNDQVAAVVHGISFQKRDTRVNLARQIAATASKYEPEVQGLMPGLNVSNNQSDKPWHIGLLHCSVGSHSDHDTYAPATLEDLTQTGIDYWALGHVHTRSTLNESHPVVIYPGNSQGLHINETGERGCLLIEVGNSGKTESEFLPLDDVRWYNEEINISSYETVNDLENGVSTALSTCSRESDGRLSILRLTLIGSGPVHSDLVHNGDGEGIDRIFFDEGMLLDPPVILNDFRILTRNMTPELLERRRSADDFIGDFLKLTHHLKNNPDQAAFLEEELDSLFKRLIRMRIIGETGLPDLAKLIEEAETICLEKLTGGDD